VVNFTPLPLYLRGKSSITVNVGGWINVIKHLIQQNNRKYKFCLQFCMDVKTWFLTLRVYENRMLRRIYGSKRDEVTGGWRKMHNEKLHNLHTSPNIIRLMKSRSVRSVGHVACIGEKTIFCLHTGAVA
jgi:hypothetical protein